MPEPLQQTDLAEQVRQQLSIVIDPEIGRSIVDMGLVYLIEVGPAGDTRILMTTTTKGCPASAFIVEAVRSSAASVPGVGSVEVTLTYDPPWHPDMMVS